MTPEEKRRVFKERMRAGRERRKALEEENARLRQVAGGLAPQGTPAANSPPVAEQPQAPQPLKQQCILCGIEFYTNLLEEHMVRVHGELPDLLRPPHDNELPPGTVVVPEGGGLPYKIRWTRERLEKDCNNWDGNPDHMHWETIDPADIGLPTTAVTYNGILYSLIAGKENRVPNVIAGELRKSRRDTQRIFQNASVGSVLPAPEEAEVT